MFPENLLDSDDDWQESLRRNLYPELHNVLIPIGGYGIAGVNDDEYVGKTTIDEETLEEELVDLGLIRNPIAAYKTHTDGRQSEGSWVLIAENDTFDLVEPGMQLHLTLLPRRDGKAGREIFAHYEDDWRDSAVAHLKAENHSKEIGVRKTTELLDEESYMVIQ